MKKMIALLLSLSMMLALVSCGTSGSSSSEGTGGSSSAQVSGGEDLTWGLTPFETQQTVRLGFSPAPLCPMASCSRIIWACSMR